jgi:DNA invertase Pin-like site-specific DNA recombinase
MSYVHGYVRASTDKQQLTGDEQRRKIQAHFEAACKSKGLEWGDCFEDPKTSSKVRLANRKAGQALLAKLKPGDHLILTSFDRAFRSLSEAVGHLERWFDRGIQVHVLDCPFLDTSHWMGRAILQLLAWVAGLNDP